LRVKKPEVLRETGERLEKHAYALVVENGYDNHARFPLLDAAWPTVAAALPRFLAGENERLQTVCDALRFFLEFTGRWDEWLAIESDAERRAVAQGDSDAAGWRAFQVGWVNSLRGQSTGVLACARRAEAHWHEAKAGARERASAIYLRGVGYELAEDYSDAIAAYGGAVELWRTLSGATEDLAAGLNALANAEQRSGDLDSAERDYREGLHIARTIDYREGVANFTGNLAALALDRADWPRGETLAREALALAEKVGRVQLIAGDCARLAQALVRQGKKEEALPHAGRAVEIFQRLGHPALAAAQQILAECEE
jgi:tetratricopeptide (TPR) repeat protein